MDQYYLVMLAWRISFVVSILALSGCSSPLVRAARDGQAEQVRVLLPAEKGRCGDALRAAAANNREPAVKALLDGGCDVNAKDKDGYTPLMMAAAKGNDDVIRLLLLRKANVDLVTWNEKTAAMIATENRHKDTARLIENLDRSLNPEVAAMVAAGPAASGGFLDNVLDAAANGAAQSMIQGAMSGKVPDMNGVAQGALRGALSGDSAGASQGLLNAAAGGAVSGAVQNLGNNPQAMLRAAATGAAVDAAGSLLTNSPGPTPPDEQGAPAIVAVDTTPQPNAVPAPAHLVDAPAAQPPQRRAPSKKGSGPFRYVVGRPGLDELVGLVRRFADKGMAWNLPGALGDAVRGQVKIGDEVGPALYGNGLDLETTPPGRIERWSETKGGGRSFFMYWLVNPLGDRAGDQSGTVAYLETDMPLPLRRRLFVVTQYLGTKTFDNAYGEKTTLPHLKVIATAATNDRYSVDGADLPEFYFDDRSIAKLEKRMNPTIAAVPSAEPMPAAPARSRAKDCATLTKIMASKDEIVAKHGEDKAEQVMVAAKKRFEEYQCAR